MSRKVLVAFDFDHTVIDENSDLYVRKLAPDGTIPKEIKDLYSAKGWTEFMGAIFKYLHENHVTSKEIISCMKEIPFVAGIPELFDFLSDELYHVIIISDSNSIFIDCIMQTGGYDKLINEVYTNPAKFDENGCLIIEYYHTQDWCELSTKNLCKGHILQEHISQQEKKNVFYDTVVYVGDGSNDLCPTLKLSAADIVFPRIGFKLEKMLQENDYEVKCHVKPWNTCSDILQVLKSLPLKPRF